MPWYYILLLVCVIIAPFDALYMYIKAEPRREELRRRAREKENNGTKLNILIQTTMMIGSCRNERLRFAAVR